MYAPFDKSNRKDGRFYLAFTVAEFQPTETSLVPANLVSRPYIRFTQGNRFPLVADPSTQERPLMFINKLLYRNVWSNYPNGFSMAYFNGSVNAVAYTPEPKSSGLTFFPNADGQFNGVQRDHDDVSAIEANLIRSLKKCQ